MYRSPSSCENPMFFFGTSILAPADVNEGVMLWFCFKPRDFTPYENNLMVTKLFSQF
jgi:hypothetical protein